MACNREETRKKRLEEHYGKWLQVKASLLSCTVDGENRGQHSYRLLYIAELCVCPKPFAQKRASGIYLLINH